MSRFTKIMLAIGIICGLAAVVVRFSGCWEETASSGEPLFLIDTNGVEPIIRTNPAYDAPNPPQNLRIVE